MNILHADEFSPKDVAELATQALRQAGGIAHIGELSVSSYAPCTNTRVWVIEDCQGRVMAEAPSLYAAIHSLAR